MTIALRDTSARPPASNPDMKQLLIASLALALALPVSVARADTRQTAAPAAPVAAGQPAAGSRFPTWTVVGAGAGFGLGVWAGLTAFDDAINSDRKVWTTAIVSAAVGGVIGFLVDRRRARPPSRPSTIDLVPTAEETRRLALTIGFREQGSGGGDQTVENLDELRRIDGLDQVSVKPRLF